MCGSFSAFSPPKPGVSIPPGMMRPPPNFPPPVSGVLPGNTLILFLYNRHGFFRNGSMKQGGQWLSGRVLDSRPSGRGFEPHRRHCVNSLSKKIKPSLVLVQPRKTRPFITEDC